MSDVSRSGAIAIGGKCPHCREAGIVIEFEDIRLLEMKCYKCSYSYTERIPVQRRTSREKSLVASGTASALRYLGNDRRRENSVLVVEYKEARRNVVPMVRQCLYCALAMELDRYSRVYPRDHFPRYLKGAAVMRCTEGHSVALVRTKGEPYTGWTFASPVEIETGLRKLLAAKDGAEPPGGPSHTDKCGGGNESA